MFVFNSSISQPGECQILFCLYFRPHNEYLAPYVQGDYRKSRNCRNWQLMLRPGSILRILLVRILKSGNPTRCRFESFEILDLVHRYGQKSKKLSHTTVPLKFSDILYSHVQQGRPALWPVKRSGGGRCGLPHRKNTPVSSLLLLWPFNFVFHDFFLYAKY